MATESPLKMMKKCFLFHFKSSTFSRYVSCCLDFSLIYRKGLIKKIKVNFKFYDVTVWLTNNCNAHITQYLQSIFYIRISTKKQAFDFLKIKSYTNYCLKFLCDQKLITSLLIFWFLVKFSRLLSWVFIDLMILERVDLNS